jgi:hypothetical protein
MRRQQVRERHSAAFHYMAEHFRIDAIGLSPVSSDAELFATSGVPSNPGRQPWARCLDPSLAVADRYDSRGKLIEK